MGDLLQVPPHRVGAGVGEAGGQVEQAEHGPIDTAVSRMAVATPRLSRAMRTR
jgi:hypothetical protein